MRRLWGSAALILGFALSCNSSGGKRDNAAVCTRLSIERLLGQQYDFARNQYDTA
jgi:hypothetical protein